MYLFGSGVISIIPNNVVNPTPLNIGLLQEISIDHQVTIKSLFGQYKDPVAIGSGTRKTTGKAKIARVSLKVMNNVLVGGTLAQGQTTTAIGEAHSVPTTPYQVTVTNSATWTVDQGVINAGTGVPLTRVASAPAAGQYSVAAGVYTHAAADTGLAMLYSYNYTVASPSGQTLTWAQNLIGAPVTWQLNASVLDPTTGNYTTAIFYNCVAEKFTWGTKLEDFAMPEIDFQCFANAAGSIGIYSVTDQL